MDLQLTNKVAVITGGSGGIGAEICRVMAKEGASVVVGYHQNPNAAIEVVNSIERQGGRAVAAQVDVRNELSVNNFFSFTSQEFGGADILVNCAGAAHFNPLEDYPERDWDKIVDTNLKGVFLCCKTVAPYFRERGGGDIVNISSLAASTGSFEGGAYAASKAGLNVLTLSLALEMANDNVRVNAVAPGRIDTPFRRTRSGPYFDFMIKQTPLKRMGTAEEVASAVAFMASRVCSFITGETLYVTGALHTVHLEHVTPDANSKLRGSAE